MTKKVCFSLLFVATLVLAGCQGFDAFFVNPNQGGGGGGGTGTSTTSGYFYVLNLGSTTTAPTIESLQVVSDKIVAGTSYPLLSNPTTMTIAHNNNFLYLGTVLGIDVCPIGTGGTLGSCTNISSIVPQSMQVDSTNSWLLVATTGSGVLSAIPIVPATGLVNTTGTLQTATLDGVAPFQLAIAPNNGYVYVALGANGTDAIPLAITAGGITNPFGATKTNIAPVNATSGTAVAVAVSPSSKSLYIAETNALSCTACNNGGLRNINITTSGSTITFTDAAGSPYASGGLAPTSILAESTGFFVYVSNQTVYSATGTGNSSNIGNITGYSITTATNAGGTTSILSALKNSPFTAGTSTIALAEDHTHSFVLAVNFGGAPDLDAYTFDTTNLGTLDQGTGMTAATGTDPVSPIAIAAIH